MTYCYQDVLVAENLVAKSQFSCSEKLSKVGQNLGKKKRVQSRLNKIS